MLLCKDNEVWNAWTMIFLAPLSTALFAYALCFDPVVKANRTPEVVSVFTVFWLSCMLQVTLTRTIAAGSCRTHTCL